MKEEKFEVTYGCGCVHELENKQGMWQPTGKNKECSIHKCK